MADLIGLKIKAAISIISLILSWIIAQMSVIEQGFDQLFSIGLLIVAVVTIWKAFSRKDESETRLLIEQIDLLKEQVEIQKEYIEKLKDENS